MAKNTKDDPIKDLYINTEIKDVMVTPVVKIYEDDDFSHAEEIFVKKRVYYLPVVNRSNKLVGMITQKYLYKTQSPRKLIDKNTDLEYAKDIIIDGNSFYSRETLDSYILNNIMFKNPVTLQPTNSLAETILLMNKMNVGCVTIVSADKTIKGIITTQDIVDFVAKILIQ